MSREDYRSIWLAEKSFIFKSTTAKLEGKVEPNVKNEKQDKKRTSADEMGILCSSPKVQYERFV